MSKLTLVFAIIVTLFNPVAVYAADIYKCDTPQGVTMWSMEGHKASPDGFKGVKPVVVIEDDSMTIVWGDSKSAGGTEKSWKALIIHRDSDMVSGVSLDTDEGATLPLILVQQSKR